MVSLPSVCQKLGMVDRVCIPSGVLGIGHCWKTGYGATWSYDLAQYGRSYDLMFTEAGNGVQVLYCVYSGSLVLPKEKEMFSKPRLQGLGLLL